MNITIEFLQKKFDEFNREFFDNELKRIPLKITNRRHQFGCFEFQRTFCSETPTRICISKYFDRSEIEVCSTLIHEMIHLWTSIKKLGRGRGSDPHGYWFTKKALEINRKQSTYVITKNSQSAHLIPKALKEGRKIYNIFVFDKHGKKYFCRVSSALKNLKQVQNKYDWVNGVALYTSTCPELDKRVCCRTALRLNRFTDETITKYDLKLVRKDLFLYIRTRSIL